MTTQTKTTNPDLGGYSSSYQYWPGTPRPYIHHDCPARWYYCPDCRQRIPNNAPVPWYQTPIWMVEPQGTQVMTGVTTYNPAGHACASV